jgi:DNA-binding response OmpR family regulator
MKILIADDDLASGRLLESLLVRRGYEVIIATDGNAAWEILQGPESPLIAVLDWLMPGYDGPQLCRMLKSSQGGRPVYVILLTSNHRKEDVAEGLEAGADDYVTKPFDRNEFLARVKAGARMVKLQQDLSRRVAELEEALSRVKFLQGLLPICCYCKNIRDDHNYWRQVEHYISDKSDVRFSHGICPDCYQKMIAPQLAAVAFAAPKRES